MGSDTSSESTWSFCGANRQPCWRGTCVSSICSCNGGWSKDDCSVRYLESEPMLYDLTRFTLMIGFSLVSAYSLVKLVTLARYKCKRTALNVNTYNNNSGVLGVAVGVARVTNGCRSPPCQWVDVNVVALFLCFLSSYLFVLYTMDPFSLEFISTQIRVSFALFATLSFEFAYAVLVRVFIRVHARFTLTTRRFLLPLDVTIAGLFTMSITLLLLAAAGELSLNSLVVGCDILVVIFALLLLGSLSIYAVTTLGSMVAPSRNNEKKKEKKEKKKNQCRCCRLCWYSLFHCSGGKSNRSVPVVEPSATHVRSGALKMDNNTSHLPPSSTFSPFSSSLGVGGIDSPSSPSSSVPTSITIPEHRRLWSSDVPTQPPTRTSTPTLTPAQVTSIRLLRFVRVSQVFLGLGVLILALDYAIDPYGHSAAVTLTYFLLERSLFMIALCVCATVLGRLNAPVGARTAVTVIVLPIPPPEILLSSRMAFGVQPRIAVQDKRQEDEKRRVGSKYSR